jgi:branched-chain amino acid transport system ATP-binding protein
MLALDAVHAHYGSAHVLQGVSLEVGAGQIACLIGRNGAGKSTTLKAVMGVVPPTGGSVTFRGARIDSRAPHAIAGLGLAWVPEDRRVFASLTVEENIRVAAQATSRYTPTAIAQAMDIFPDLKQKKGQRAGSLSGGQQQMLAMARALASRPDLILLDEPTEGLSPLLVKVIKDGILEIRSRGASILLVEQNLPLALGVGDVFYVLSRGAVVYRGTREELLATPAVIQEYLGVGSAKSIS